MDGQRAFFVFVLLLFILLSPDRTPRHRFPLVVEEDLAAQREREFNLLATAGYGQLEQRGLNLSGFRQEDGYRWDLLKDARELSRQQRLNLWRGLDGSLSYSEITGQVRGSFTRSDLSSTGRLPINLTAVDPRKAYVSSVWQRNITEDKGEISLILRDSPTTPGSQREPKEIRADLGLYVDSGPGNGWQASLQGAHFAGSYSVLSTSSTKFNAVPAWPQFALDSDGYAAMKLLNTTLEKTWDRRSAIDDLEQIGLPDCELIVWLVPKPLGLSESHVRLIEDELVHPEGAPIGQPPPLSFSAVILSPDCGYLLQADNLFGPKAEAYIRLADRLLMAFCLLLCLQIILLKRQMEKAATPSKRSRIAYQGLVISALGDGLMLLFMISLLMLDEAGFLVVAAASFLSGIHVAFLEVKFVFDIWTVQVGDPARAEYERQRRSAPPQTPAPAPTPTPASDELPRPATAPRLDGATPIIITSDGEEEERPPAGRASFATIYSRFYFTLVCLMFVSLWALSWPRWLRSWYANGLVFAYFSLWWPQIYRNTMRNCRKALSWEYVLGKSLTQTVPVLYWYFADGNILSIETSPTSAHFLLAWVWLQVAIMASQQFLGPRRFVKDSWCPSAYDYHPLLQDDVEAGGMPIGLVASASEAKDKEDVTRKVFDCAICMNEIDVPVLSKTEPARGTTWLERVNYMVTPCRHIFHAACLEGWMDLSSSSNAIEARGKGDELHPDVVRGAQPEFQGDKNPKTGEIGGPKNEPLRWGPSGEWTYNGRTTDF
ncbi:hypothetical protein DV736_g3513, partial [Chaetothyriales sp. CBS 134916]